MVFPNVTIQGLNPFEHMPIEMSKLYRVSTDHVAMFDIGEWWEDAEIMWDTIAEVLDDNS